MEKLLRSMQLRRKYKRKSKTPIKTVIFVNLLLDEAGLDPYEFRILAHIARRGNCFASLAKIAETCQMSVRKAQYALKALYEKGYIVKESRPGHTDKYQLARDLLLKLSHIHPSTQDKACSVSNLQVKVDENTK